MRVEMLGVARVVLPDGEAITLRPTMRDRALAYLAYGGEWVPRDRLGFLFWPDSPDDTARHNVRQLLKRINRLTWLEQFEVDGEMVRWSIPTDVDALRTAIATESWDALPVSIVLLPGFERNAHLEFESWLLREREIVSEMVRTGRLAASSALERQGAIDEAAKALEPILTQADGHLVLHRYRDLTVRAGNKPLAVGAFERVSTDLEEAGLDPPRDAVELMERLGQLDERPSESRRAVGRARETTDVVDLLGQPECRLLTLLGPGGIGKSTLAQIVVEGMSWRYSDGSHLVSLEAVSDPGAIASRIATELSLSLDPGIDPATQLTHHLRRQHLLLGIDNAEHLPAGWTLFSTLLARCPQLQLLVTSRERLRLDEEWLYEVGGLTDDDAVELFRRRAQRIVPELEVSAPDALAISRAVGGSPLGIELAAPWLRVMSCHEIAAEISQDPQILSGGGSDALARHRSIEATMTHSWKLLSDAEREAIEALSVFDSPVSRHLAEEVAAISAVTLRSLIDKSLLRRDSGGRHSSHPLVSQYAASRLAADEARRQTVRHRHAQAVLTRLGPNQALDQKELLDDALQAWNHAVEHKDLELLAASAEGVTLLLEASGQCRRGLDLLRRADEAAEGHEAAQDRIRALSRVNQARLLQHLGEHEMAAEAARAALEGGNEVEDPRVQVMARLDLGWAEKWIQGDEAQYRSTMEALPLAEVLGDRILLAEVRNGLGCSAPTLEECKRQLLAALSLVDSATREDLRSVILCNLGNVCWGLGDIREAIESLEKALTVARDHGSTLRNLDDLIDLAFFRAEAGDLEGALALADEAESVDEDSEFLVKSAYLAVVAGEIHERAGDLDGARKRMGRALRLAKSIGNEPFALRALRLRGLLLMDQGEQDDGLGVLAFVLPRAGRRGDFTSEILNPRIWAERTESIDPERVHRATQWAEDQTLDKLVNQALAEVIQTSVR